METNMSRVVWGTLTEVRCMQCEKTFTRHTGRVNYARKKGKSLYCSQACSSVARAGSSVLDRFMSHVMPEPNSGCWLWVGTIKCGPKPYGQFSIAGRSYRAHRVSYELHKGPIQAEMVVRHKCDVHSCVNPDHLVLGTVADNNDDAVKRNPHHWVKPGEAHGSSKLTADDVRELRRLRSEGVAFRTLRARFNIADSTARKIVKREYWLHV